MDKIKKFLLNLTEKDRIILMIAMSDISSLSIENYDVRQLKKHKDLFRLKKGNISVIFKKQLNKGRIIDINGY